MSTKVLAFRIVLLSLSLGFVIYSIIHLRSKGIESTEVGKVITGQASSDKKPESYGSIKQWEWCKLPLQSINWSNHRKPAKGLYFEKREGSWVVRKNGSKSFRPSSIGNWLKDNCIQGLQAIKGIKNPRRDFRLFVRFENQKALDLEFADSASHMIWQDRVYFASGFLKALVELTDAEFAAIPEETPQK